MRWRVIAVGTRLGGWAEVAFNDYSRRLRGAAALELCEVPPGRRSARGDAARAMATESERILALLESRSFNIALDERGRQFSSVQLGEWLAVRRQSGERMNFIIGGADGLGEAVLQRAALRWSLSSLTLPHALARVLVAEQLYRATTMLAGHPYHRE